MEWRYVDMDRDSMIQEKVPQLWNQITLGFISELLHLSDLQFLP